METVAAFLVLLQVEPQAAGFSATVVAFALVEQHWLSAFFTTTLAFSLAQVEEHSLFSATVAAFVVEQHSLFGLTATTAAFSSATSLSGT